MPVGTDRYPSDPGDPMKRMEERIRNLEQIVAELARRNPLNDGMFHGTLRNVDGSGNTLGQWSPTGFVLYDTAGNIILRLDAEGLSTFDPGDGLPRQVSGVFSDGVTSFTGWVIYDGDGIPVLMTRNDKAGLIKPDIPAPFVQANQSTVVTSATYVPVANVNPRRLYHDVLRLAVVVISDASTTGQIRLRETIGGATTTALTTTAGVQQTAVFEWLHGRQVGDDPGDDVNFVLEALRASGAGNITAFTPIEASYTSSALVTADANGNAHFA